MEFHSRWWFAYFCLVIPSAQCYKVRFTQPVFLSTVSTTSPTVRSIAPTAGPSEGGTVVAVQGTGFYDGQAATCEIKPTCCGAFFYSPLTFPATVKSSSELQCIMPAVQFESEVNLSISLQDTLRLLDVANAAGLRVIIPLCDLSVKRHCLPKVLSPQHWEKVTTLVRHVQDHPGLLGYYIDDDVPDANPSNLKRYYDHVKSLDPWHPCFVAIVGSGDAWRYGGLNGPSFDVAMVEVYVPSTDYAQTGLELDIVNSFPLDWMPLWGCIMASSFFSGSSLWGTRQQSYLSILHQATGLVHFIYDFPFQEYGVPGGYDDPTTIGSLSFQQAQLVTAELFELQQSIISSDFIAVNVTLASGPWPRGGPGTARLYQDQNFASREEHSGCVHVAAVNVAPWPDIIRVQLDPHEWPSVLNATVPFENNRAVQFLNGKLEEPIGFLDTRVYRLDCAPASLMPGTNQTIQNMFQNPEFESTTYPGTPDGWGISRSPDFYNLLGSFNSDTQFVHQGRHSLRLFILQNASSGVLLTNRISRNVNLTNGSAFAGSIWALPSAGNTFQVSWVLNCAIEVSLSSISAVDGKRNPWKWQKLTVFVEPFQVEHLCPSAAHVPQVGLQLKISGTGVLWFDTAELRVVL
ncbi:hypothetical protein CYMTET_54483 [Cymbomonas tetramitiformis]|uniref:IPT/TIG domain-containing protein n=1 Tax=Cymbomonas tetramitiformis TaxID=36881 RepID=A0AAE0BEU2_9CHLO|nr:hypothetical protein CYMTET_54483 [Cymbomonas tetramitiformis]